MMLSSMGHMRSLMCFMVYCCCLPCSIPRRAGVQLCRRLAILFDSATIYSKWTEPFAFQKSQTMAIAALMEPAIQRAAVKSLPSVRKPPATAAPKKTRTDAILRFLLWFSDGGAVTSFGSIARSQYVEVRTTVGTSLKPRTREITVCPPAK
jgi:hypothetical protein